MKNAEYIEDKIFKVHVPKYCPGVPCGILDPKNTWNNTNEYYFKARELAQKFRNNFSMFKDVPENIVGLICIENHHENSIYTCLKIAKLGDFLACIN